MRLEQSFTVAAPIEDVWTALLDVERVASCLPGAEITGQGPDGAYEGEFTVKLGPTTAAYKGSLRMEEVDVATHTATMSAKGSDKRGQGGATATIVTTLREDGPETAVEVVSDFTITGRLARFGRSGMMEDISKHLLGDFATCLQSRLGGERAREPEVAAVAAIPAPEPVEPLAAAPAALEPVEPMAPAPAAAEPVGHAAGEPDPFGPVGPPPAAPEPEEEAEPVRRESIPPPSMARPTPPPAKPVNGLALLLSALGGRIKRLFRRRG